MGKADGYVSPWKRGTNDDWPVAPANDQPWSRSQKLRHAPKKKLFFVHPTNGGTLPPHPPLPYPPLLPGRLQYMGCFLVPGILSTCVQHNKPNGSWRPRHTQVHDHEIPPPPPALVPFPPLAPFFLGAIRFSPPSLRRTGPPPACFRRWRRGPGRRRGGRRRG